MRAKPGRLALACLILALAGVSTLTIGASQAQAQSTQVTDIAPYLSTVNDDALWHELSVTGSAWPDTFPASWAAPAAEEVSVAAAAMPEVAAAGPLVLGAGAFTLGWMIGRQIDTKFLHLNGDIGTSQTGMAVSNYVRNEAWVSNFVASAGPYSGQTVPWVVRVRTSSSTSNYPIGWSFSIRWPLSCQDGREPGNGCDNTNVGGMSYTPNQAISLGQTAMALAQSSTSLSPSWVQVTANVCRAAMYCTAPGYAIFVTKEAMDAALVHSLPVPYTGQGVDVYTQIPAPVKNSTNLTNARNKITALGQAVQNEYNASLDPADWARPGPNGSPVGGYITDWTMPNCRALTVAACESAISSAAEAANAGSVSFSGATATTEAADLTVSAGLVISTSPAAGTGGRPSSVTFTKNPTPVPIVWPLPDWNETYDQYLGRLRSLGWVGQAMPVDLDENNGEPDYVATGVPCTSVLGGARIAGDAPVTLYRNPASMGTGDPGAGLLCGDADISSFTSDLCSFYDMPWNSIMADNPYFYSTACEEAWSLVRSLTVFNADGTADASSLYRLIATGDRFRDEELKRYLQAIDPNLSHWEKWSTPIYDPAGPRPFEIHFYWNSVTHLVEYGRGFKVRFKQRFYPGG